MRYFFQAIVAYPPTKVLTSEEQDLVWKFRFYLSSQKKVTILTNLYFYTVKFYNHYKEKLIRRNMGINEH